MTSKNLVAAAPGKVVAAAALSATTKPGRPVAERRFIADVHPMPVASTLEAKAIHIAKTLIGVFFRHESRIALDVGDAVNHHLRQRLRHPPVFAHFTRREEPWYMNTAAIDGAVPTHMSGGCGDLVGRCLADVVLARVRDF